jgi:hypothetical protein
VNRREFRELARLRLREAKALLDSRNFSGAYYLCGYVIECGLKACIAKQTKQYEFPDKKRVNDSYTHDLEILVRTAGLDTDLRARIGVDPQFAVNWSLTKDWNEGTRYQKHTRLEAESLYDAVTDAAHGVLQWIQRYW